jgi:hypothetical protein
MLIRGGPRVVRVAIGIVPRGVGSYPVTGRLSNGWSPITVTVAADATTGVAGERFDAVAGRLRIVQMHDLGRRHKVAAVSGRLEARLRSVAKPTRWVHVAGKFGCLIDAADNTP